MKKIYSDIKYEDVMALKKEILESKPDFAQEVRNSKLRGEMLAKMSPSEIDLYMKSLSIYNAWGYI